jgi:hypothetical protein
VSYELFNRRHAIEIEREDESLFDLLPDDGTRFPIVRQIWQKFYGSMVISPSMVPGFRDEIAGLLAVHTTRITPEIRRAKNITATDPTIAHAILEGLLAKNRTHKKLTEILALCDDSIATGESIEGVGD